MNDPAMLPGFRSREVEALFKLDRWLSYEVKSGWVLFLLFWMPVGIVMSGLYLLIAVFLPLILFQLYRARWFKTLGFFVALVGTGYFVPRTFSLDPRMLMWAYAISLFVPFYFSCYILRWVVAEKVGEIRDMEALERMGQPFFKAK